MERAGDNIVRTLKPRIFLGIILCKYIFGIFSLSDEEKARLKAIRDVQPLAKIAKKILEWQDRDDFKQSRQGETKYFSLLQSIGFNGNALKMLDESARIEVISKLEHWVMPATVEDYGTHVESSFKPGRRSAKPNWNKERGCNDTGPGFISGGTHCSTTVGTLHRLKAFVSTLTALEMYSQANSITVTFDDEIRSGVKQFEKSVRNAMCSLYSAKSLFQCGGSWARRMINLLTERSDNLEMKQILQTLVCVCVDQSVENDPDGDLVPYGDLIKEIQNMIENAGDAVDGPEDLWIHSSEDATFYLSEEVKQHLFCIGVDNINGSGISSKRGQKAAHLLYLVAVNTPLAAGEIAELVTILDDRHNTALFIACNPGLKEMSMNDHDYMNRVIDVYATSGYTIMVSKRGDLCVVDAKPEGTDFELLYV